MVSFPARRFLRCAPFSRFVVAFFVAIVGLETSGPDVSALTLMNTIPAGPYPSWIAINPSNNLLYVTDYDGSQVSIVDPTKQQIVGTIPVGARPRSIAINPNTNRAYVTNTASGTVSVIDLGSNSVIDTISFPAFSSPVPWHATVSLAMNRIYVTIDQTGGDVEVIDGGTDQIVDTLQTGNVPFDVVVNALNNQLYVGVGSPAAAVDVFDGSTDLQIATIVTGQTGEVTDRMALNPQTNRLYASIQLQNNGHISVIDTTTNQVITNIPVSGLPDGIAVDPCTNLVYIGDLTQPFWLWVLNGQTNAVAPGLVPGTQPLAVTVDGAASIVYTANTADNDLSVINTGPATCQIYLPLIQN